MTLNVNGFYPGELQPDEIVGGCINIYENAWPNPKETINMIEATCNDTESGVYWQRAETLGHGPWQDKRTNDLLSVSHLANLTNNKILQNVHNQFYILLLAAVNPYCQRYGIAESVFFESYSLLKYRSNQEYKTHYDGTTNIGRIISALVYLNDDYTGGELEFPNFGVKIKPEPGMLILFPSNFAYAHTAYPVTVGTKYALVTWITDRKI